jgi:hypothetical protein
MQQEFFGLARPGIGALGDDAGPIADRAPRQKAPPTMIGGCGFWTGLGQVTIGGKSSTSPRYSAFSLVQITFIETPDDRNVRVFRYPERVRAALLERYPEFGRRYPVFGEKNRSAKIHVCAL